MKYVITGGAGSISKPLAITLLDAGHQVTVIGRHAGKLQSLTDKGADTAVGSVENEAFLAATFKGADAVYLMIPPSFEVENFREYQNKIGAAYIKALKAAGVKFVVVLSSIGAHMGNGAGPIDGLADFEMELAKVEGLHAKILRPSYFMYNLLNMIPLIKGMNIMGSNFGGTDQKLVLTHTDDIAAVAAEELLALNFTGQTIRYIASDEKNTAEIAALLGTAVEKEVPWVVFTDEQSMDGMLQAGLPATIAQGYVTMGQALRSGDAEADYWKHRPVLGTTKLSDFAVKFTAAYNAE